MKGVRDLPGVPQKGWRQRGDRIDLGRGGPYEVCEWCRKKRVRYVDVMVHNGWPNAVRAGRICSALMRVGVPDAIVSFARRPGRIAPAAGVAHSTVFEVRKDSEKRRESLLAAFCCWLIFVLIVLWLLGVV
jgi:hypothetical protein